MIDPLRPPRNRRLIATSLPRVGSTVHPINSYANADHKAPRTFPNTIFLKEFNPATALPLERSQQEAEEHFLLEELYHANGQDKCQIQRDILIGLARSCGRYLQDVSGSGNMCFTFSVMATAYGIYTGNNYPDFSDQRQVLDAVGSSRGRMTAAVDAADAKLALEYGIPVMIVDNHPLYGLSFYLTLPTQMDLSKNGNSIPLRDTDCVSFTLKDFPKQIGDRAEVVEAMAKYAQQRREMRTREGLRKMTFKDVARQTLENPWVLCIYHYGTHYQALIVKNPETALRNYPDHYPLNPASVLLDVVRNKYQHNEA